MDIICPLAKVGLYYLDLVAKLQRLLQEKDFHIKGLREKLHDLGGSYSPRKCKHALTPFEEDKWRSEQRKNVGEQVESGLHIFSRWAEVSKDELSDWEAVTAALGQWTAEEMV